MLAWAKTLKATTERDLTRAQVEKAYKQGLKARSWTLTALQDLGYDEDESELIVLLIDSQKQSEVLEENIEHLRRLYVRDILTKEELTKGLNDLGLTEAHKTEAIDKAERERRARIRLPSKADLMGWLKKGVITENELTDRMLALGYLNEDIARYIEATKETP